MAKRYTPLKDEQEYNVDDLYQELDDIKKAIKELADRNLDGEQQNGSSAKDSIVTTENFATYFKKGYKGLRNGYVTERKGLLFDKDLENIGEKFKTKYDEFTEKLITKGNENRDAEKKRRSAALLRLSDGRMGIGILRACASLDALARQASL